MSKKPKYTSDIENILKKESLNLENLYNIVTGIKKYTNSNKPFFGALMQLLKENKIVISGYDFNIHDVKDGRIQSFIPKGLKLEWVKREQTEILSLLHQMEDLSDLENVKMAKNQILEIFTLKFKDHEKKN